MTQALRSLIYAIALGVIMAFAAFGLWQLLYPTPAATAQRTSYAAAVNRAAPSVVQIVAHRRDSEIPLHQNPLLDELFGTNSVTSTLTSQGSGIVARADGHILTNHHIVRDAERVTVTQANGQSLPATIVGIDAETDIAVLKVDTTAPMQAIVAGDDGKLSVGDIVLAIGNPFGIGQTVTQGIVSALRRQVGGFSVYDQFIQTDAAINPGSSGGALVNQNGELIGLNTSVFNGAEDARGISFAIPSRMLFSIANQIIDKGAISRGWLGITGTDVAASALRERAINGVVVTGVYQGSAAANAGVLPGDVIDGIDEQPTPDSQSLTYATSHVEPGSEIILHGRRKGKKFQVPLTMGQRNRQ